MSYAQAAKKGPKQSPEEARAPAPPQMAQHDLERTSLIDVDTHLNSVPADFEPRPVKTMTQAERLAREAEDKARSAAAQQSHSSLYHKKPARKETPLERDAKQTSHDLKQKGKQVEKDTKEIANEVAENTKQFAQKTEKEISDFAAQASSDAKDTYYKAEKKTEELSREAREKAKELGHEAKVKAKEYSEEAKELGHEARVRADRAGDDLRRNSDNPVYIGNAIVVAVLSAGLGFGAYRKYAQGELSWQVVGLWAGMVGLFAGGDYYVSQYLFKNKYPKK